MKYIDLHVHSNYSDGTFTPSELVAYALAKGLGAFALTDHDTTEGLTEAFDAAGGTGLEVISGIEFSTEYRGKDIHIVGLDFDHTLPEFQTQLLRFQDSRRIRNEKMIKRMQEEGVSISWESMEKAFGDAIWTRAHFARYLKDHGYVSAMSDAFKLYLGDDACCFVPREKVTPDQAVHLIRSTGGIPILAHPLLYHLSDKTMNQLLDDLKRAGLLGIEVFYSTHSGFEEDHVRFLARRHGLCFSGGSDFHGTNKPNIDLGVGRGNLKISYNILKQLRKAR